MIQKTITFFCLLLLIAFVGCSDTPTDSNGIEGIISLDSEFGGYTANAESFAFNDPLLISESSKNSDYNDPLSCTPKFDSLQLGQNVNHYHMRILWGQLCYDSTHSDVTDWTGSLQVSQGGIVVKNLIHWEENQDFLVERTDPQLVEWVSLTTVHNDGIAVDIHIPIVPPIYDSTITWIVDSLGDSSQVIVVDTTFPEVDPVEVTFTTGPYTRIFDISELELLDTVVNLPDSNSVLFYAFKKEKRECPSTGFVNGFWGFNDKGAGKFMGVWVANEGFQAGFVQGHFGVNEAGENVLFGKFINSEGGFEGYLKGNYHISPDSSNVIGMYRARIYNAFRMEIGVVEGRFRHARHLEDGFMGGKWRIRCTDFGNMTNTPSVSENK